MIDFFIPKGGTPLHGKGYESDNDNQCILTHNVISINEKTGIKAVRAKRELKLHLLAL